MELMSYIIECFLLVLTGIAGWLAVSRKMSSADNASLRPRALTPAGRVAFWTMLTAVVLSLALATIRQVASVRQECHAREHESILLHKIDTQASEIQTLRDLSVPVRKLIYRLTFKQAIPTLACTIEMWRNASGFSVLRNRVRVSPSGDGRSLVAQTLRASRDASFVVDNSRKGISVMSLSSIEDNVDEDLPVQHRIEPLESYVETRVIPKENLTMQDLLLSRVMFLFGDQHRSKLSASVLSEIKRIQVYADVSEGKVVVCTYQPGSDTNLLAAAATSQAEIFIEHEGYVLHQWPIAEGIRPNGLAVRLPDKPFSIQPRGSALERLPDL
jgi:hypothetical protein